MARVLFITSILGTVYSQLSYDPNFVPCKYDTYIANPRNSYFYYYNNINNYQEMLSKYRFKKFL